MNEERRKTYLAWLNDAYAMEVGLIAMLETQIEDAEGHPELQERLTQHLEETKRHADLIQSCAARNDSSTSAGEDVLGEISTTISGLSISLMSDAPVKNVHGSYVAEHFEIATYLTLRAAAGAVGDNETARICDDILKDEERMAAWLAAQLPEVVSQHFATL